MGVPIGAHPHFTHGIGSIIEGSVDEVDDLGSGREPFPVTEESMGREALMHLGLGDIYWQDGEETQALIRVGTAVLSEPLLRVA